MQAIDGAFAGSPFAPEHYLGGTSGVQPKEQAVPPRAFPNPFTSTTRIRWCETNRGDAAPLAVFDAGGRCLALLETPRGVAGARSAVWDGRDRAGRKAASGTYYLRPVGRARSWSVPVILVR